MSLSAKELIELLRYQKDGVCDLAAAYIEAQERDKEIDRQVIAEANNSLYGSQGYFLSLNGESPNKYHLANGIEKLKEELNEYRMSSEDIKRMRVVF